MLASEISRFEELVCKGYWISICSACILLASVRLPFNSKPSSLIFSAFNALQRRKNLDLLILCAEGAIIMYDRSGD